MRDILLNVFNDLGISIDSSEINSDFDVSAYFIDSIQFISFIVEVEKVLGIELPDEFLLLPNYSSFNALCCALMNISEKAKENLCEKGGENT